jgi:bacterioferritin (cytochrome b1)
VNSRLAQAITEKTCLKKKKKEKKVGKRKRKLNKLFLFEDIIFYTEKPKDFMKKLLELINEFSLKKYISQ